MNAIVQAEKVLQFFHDTKYRRFLSTSAYFRQSSERPLFHFVRCKCHSKQKGMFHVLCHQTSEICKAGLPFCLGIKISISLACDILPVIAKQLLWNLSVSQLIRFMFECFLKVHAIKWILCSVIGRGNRNNNGRICVFPTSARITHTIDTGFFLHGGSIYDITAGHMQKEYTPRPFGKLDVTL